MKKLLLLLALLAIPSAASAQCNGVFPNGTVCGNSTGASAIPRAINPASLLGAAGGTNGQIQYNNNGALGGLTVPTCSSAGQTLQWTGTAFTCASGSTSGSGNTFASREVAVGLDLTGLTTIRTLSYYTSGGKVSNGLGGATFRNVGSAAFIDSFITTFSIQGGSGCTNGTYGAPSGSITTTAIIWNKSGNPSYAIGTATVSGNVLTAVDISHTPGNGYSVGDVLTAGGAFTGCAVQPTITVTGVSTPLASFTDTAGNHWQYTPNGFVDVTQFGCIGDWNGTDAGTTDNFNCMQAAVWFAGYKSSQSFDAGGFWGGRVYVPSGSYKMCGSTYFVLGEGTTMEGASASGSSSLHLCDSYNTALHGFTICDPNWGFACLSSRYTRLAFHASLSVPVASGSYMIYSNNLQDFGGLSEVYFYAGQRGCFWFERGYGGASWVGAEKVSCNAGSPNNIMVKIGDTTASGMNFGSTIVALRDIVMGGPSSGTTVQLQGGMALLGGAVTVRDSRCENINQWCIFAGVPNDGNNLQMFLHNINSQGCASGGTCDGVISLAAQSIPGNTVLGMIYGGGGYTNLIQNSLAGGVSINTPITNFARFNPNFVQP